MSEFVNQKSFILKALCLLLCVSLLLPLVGCGKTAQEGTGRETVVQGGADDLGSGETNADVPGSKEPGTDALGTGETGVLENSETVFLPRAKKESHVLEEEVLEEAEGCFRYFWDLVQTEEDSGAYGLIRDRYPGSRNVASIASTGFGLAAIPYGIEKGWITFEEGEERADKTLDTLLSLENYSGFLYHFINMLNGNRGTGSEVSIIDTGLLLCGALTAGEYFGGSVKEKAQELYDRVDWSFYLDGSNNLFYMSYSPEDGFAGHWDVYGEQLLLYVLGAGSSTHPMEKSTYYAFRRLQGSYQDYTFVHSWFGSIFTYQYSHAFVDFEGLRDERGTDWYENSVAASLAARQYCMDQQEEFAGYGPDSWGLTACDTPDGYNGLLGAPPSGTDNRAHQSEGTIAPAGAIGSMPFTPQESIAALKHYQSFPDLVGEYGLKDSYNLDRNWYDSDYIGIDKGISLLMIANYENGFIWDLFMQNANVQNGLVRLGFTAGAEEAE